MAGDVVRHAPTGEEWILACDEERGEVMPCGWPMCIAKSKDCALVKAATEDEMLKTWAEKRVSESSRDWRTLTARRQWPDEKAHLRQPDYNPAQCLLTEVERFKATNRFTPMDVTGFYIQAAVVLDEHRRMVEALKQLSECNLTDDNCAGLDVANRRIRNIARRALPMSETPRTPNDGTHRPPAKDSQKAGTALPGGSMQ